MKTKAQKRLEAIQRLENQNPHIGHLEATPRLDGQLYIKSRQEIIDRRHAEAKRLREAFKL